MKRKMVVAILLTTIAMSSGCATNINIHPATRVHLDEEHFFEKNYEIDKRIITYVGQPIIKVRDYWVSRYIAQKSMHASSDFIVTMGAMGKITGHANKEYIITGETTLRGQTYSVLEFPGTANVLLINADGSVHNEIFFRTQSNLAIPSIWTATTDPSDLKFIPLEGQEILPGKGKLNYELIYGGTDGKMITVTYREFSPENLARSSFYQNLVFDSKQKIIRFRDIVIEVHSATNQNIDFTVISDGLKK
jgi:hypothetical protein